MIGLDQCHCAPLKGFRSHSFILPTHHKWPLTTVFTTISLLFSRISRHQTSERPLRHHLHDSVIFCCIHPPLSIHLFSWVMLDSFRILISQPYSTYLCTVCLEQRDILWIGGKRGHFQWVPSLFLLLQPIVFSDGLLLLCKMHLQTVWIYYTLNCTTQALGSLMATWPQYFLWDVLHISNLIVYSWISDWKRLNPKAYLYTCAVIRDQWIDKQLITLRTWYTIFFSALLNFSHIQRHIEKVRTTLKWKPNAN